MAMSSAFTTANRRKKLATYGKASRSQATSLWNEDASSPDRQRKQIETQSSHAQRTSSTYGARSKPANTGAGSVNNPEPHNAFEAPTDEEAAYPPTSVRPKMILVEPQVATDEFDVPSSSDEGALSRRPAGKVAQSVRIPASLRRPPTTKPQPLNVARTEQTSPNDPSVFPKKRAKSPHILQRGTLVQTYKRLEKKTAVKPRPVSPATTLAPRVTSPAQKSHAALLPAPKKLAEKGLVDDDIFDVPLSDEDVPLRTPRVARSASMSRGRTLALPQVLSPKGAPESYTESDDSNPAKKRKRQTSRQPAQTQRTRDHKAVASTGRETKYLKKASSFSPGHDVSTNGATVHPTVPTTKQFPMNKPKRTKLQTVPSLAPAPITKGQSSPAKLHDMLAVRSLSRPVPMKSSVSGTVHLRAMEDETMYDVANPGTPLAKPRKLPVNKMVTPRQNQAFNNLLGDSSDSAVVDMPSISRLQLTDRRPGSGASGLHRSSSDIPQSNHTRRPRLIDSLMQAAPTLSEEEDSESDEELEMESTIIPGQTGTGVYSTEESKYTTTSGSVDSESEALKESQPSQTTVHFMGANKVTYAKLRSYRKESNPEDELLLAMDFDEPDEFGSQKSHHPTTDDEDDPTSQVRGIHELRKQGQNQKFKMEVQTAIDDISGKAGLGSSMRRSAMLELCTRMADGKFVEQLLDSALVQQFLRSLTSKNEVIFDLAAVVAVALIIHFEPGYTVLEQIHQSDIMKTLSILLDMQSDVNRIGKERKTNLSRVGQESVADLRNRVQGAPIWPADTPPTISPQIVALKALELLVLGLRRLGNTEPLIHEDIVDKLVAISVDPCERLRTGSAHLQDRLVLSSTFSILEAASISVDKQATWSNKILQRLAAMIPVFFDADDSSAFELAVRLCMNITNNKPKTCEFFAGPSFILPLIHSVRDQFSLLAGRPDMEIQTAILQKLMFSLGTLINLAEFSDHARVSVLAENEQVIASLVTTFLEGSERASQADSLEASRTNVAVGYLTVLLGNLCLNDSVRQEVRSRLPGGSLNALIEQIREFVRVNEKLDRESQQFKGEQGRETWRNFTTRLMLVAEKLEKAM